MHTEAQEELDEALASMERTDIIFERINEWLLKNNETSARVSNYTSPSCFLSLVSIGRAIIFKNFRGHSFK